jgi:hypothetical protein
MVPVHMHTCYHTFINNLCPPLPSLTEAQLGPLVSKVVVHPSLGVAAAQLEPSLVVQASAGGMSMPLGMLSGEEYVLARWVAVYQGPPSNCKC